MLDIMGLDIMGLDIMGLDILGIIQTAQQLATYNIAIAINQCVNLCAKFYLCVTLWRQVPHSKCLQRSLND